MNETPDGTTSTRAPWLPPRWFMRSFWVAQRAIYRISGRRVGLRTATDNHQGMMHLRTVGRRSGKQRSAIISYYDDEPNIVTMAMNGWGNADPAWWLNLQANPDTIVDLPGGPRPVHARAAEGEERARLWSRWATYDRGLDQIAARRGRETAVVVFEPRSSPGTTVSGDRQSD